MLYVSCGMICDIAITFMFDIIVCLIFILRYTMLERVYIRRNLEKTHQDKLKQGVVKALKSS